MRKKKAGENRIVKLLGAIFGYITAIALVVIFALFCSGRVGWFLLLVLILAPVFSFVWTVISKNYIRVSLSTDTKLMEKGSYGNFDIVIHNRFFLPVPEVTVYTHVDGHLDTYRSTHTIYARPYGDYSSDKGIYAVYPGLAEISIVRAEVSDFFGIFRFVIFDTSRGADTRKGQKFSKNIIGDSKICIGILPENRMLEKEEEWLLAARTAAFDGEDPEDSVDDRSVTFGGFPGYEHREYIPGDPIKRINYKLSARLDKYMVRLDEQQAVAGISMMLANRLPDEHKPDDINTIRWTAAALEEYMGVATHLFMMDFAVTVYLPGEEPYELREGNDLELLREKLAGCRFVSPDDSEHASEIVFPNKGSLIVCTAFYENNTTNLLKEYSYGEGNAVSIYVSSLGEGRRL